VAEDQWSSDDHSMVDHPCIQTGFFEDTSLKDVFESFALPVEMLMNTDYSLIQYMNTHLGTQLEDVFQRLTLVWKVDTDVSTHAVGLQCPALLRQILNYLRDYIAICTSDTQLQTFPEQIEGDHHDESSMESSSLDSEPHHNRRRRVRHQDDHETDQLPGQLQIRLHCDDRKYVNAINTDVTFPVELILLNLHGNVLGKCLLSDAAQVHVDVSAAPSHETFAKSPESLADCLSLTVTVDCKALVEMT
jgi:hypothetical protein